MKYSIFQAVVNTAIDELLVAVMRGFGTLKHKVTQIFEIRSSEAKLLSFESEELHYIRDAKLNFPHFAPQVSPEFLAALPPNIQEEVLAQQRAEQARLATIAARDSATAQVNNPAGNAAPPFPVYPSARALTLSFTMPSLPTSFTPSLYFQFVLLSLSPFTI